MDSYFKNMDFYFLMTEYLSEGKALHEIFTSSDHLLQFRVTKFFEDSENRKFDEVMPEIVRNLESRGYLSEKRYNQFCIVKKVADRRAGVEAEEVLKLMYTSYIEFLWSDTAGSILFDHYGDIVRVILNEYIDIQTDAVQFIKEALPEVLSGCIMNNLDSCTIIAYRGEEEEWVFCGSEETLDDEETDEQINEDDDDFKDEYLIDKRYINCYIISSGGRKPECFLKSNGAFEIPVDLIEDDVRLEDLVTVVDDETGDAVTYQIVGKIKDRDDTEILAYKAIDLPYPILHEEDIEQYIS